MKILKTTSKLFLSAMATVFLIIAVSTTQAQAQTYWTGTNYTFTNPGNGATDVLNAAVWLTRSPVAGMGSGGLYNAVLQTGPNEGPQPPPAGTEWAIGTLAEYMANTNSLTFESCPL